jgi:hypothetical protein
MRLFGRRSDGGSGGGGGGSKLGGYFGLVRRWHIRTRSAAQARRLTLPPEDRRPATAGFLLGKKKPPLGGFKVLLLSWSVIQSQFQPSLPIVCTHQTTPQGQLDPG